MYEENRYLMDTHTAVGYKVYQDYGTTGDKTTTVIASTASAYKFADSVASAVVFPKKPMALLPFAPSTS